MLDNPLSITGVTSILLTIISVVGIVSAPFWIDAFTKQELPSGAGVTITLVMLGLKFIGWFAPKLKAMGKGGDDRRRHLDELSIRQFNIIKEIFAALPEDCLPSDQQWRLRLMDKLLGCILHLVKATIPDAKADSLQSTLISFDGKSAEKLKILARARDTRASNIDLRAEQTIAYFVALSDKIFIVNDLRAQRVFPNKGLSRDKATYRSILLIPIIVHNKQRKDCVGLVTIDSPRPSEFWGDIGDNLATQLIPFVHILSVMMRTGYPRIPIEET